MAGDNVEKSKVCMEKTTSVELTGSSMFLSGSATCFANPTIPLHGDEMETKGGSPPARTHSHGSAAACGGGMSTRQEEDCSGLGGGGDVDKRIRGVFRSHKNYNFFITSKPHRNIKYSNFSSHRNHIEILNIANDPCMEY